MCVCVYVCMCVCVCVHLGLKVKCGIREFHLESQAEFIHILTPLRQAVVLGEPSRLGVHCSLLNLSTDNSTVLGFPD